MKSRAKIKANRKLKREELIDRRDYCGNLDLTPYTAVKNIVRRQEAEKDC